MKLIQLYFQTFAKFSFEIQVNMPQILEIFVFDFELSKHVNDSFMQGGMLYSYVYLVMKADE